MKKNDVIFAVICGLSVAWIASDFFGKYKWIFFVVLPLLSVLGLWLADLIGNPSAGSGQRKYLFVWQAAKFCLAGEFADVVDIKVFQFLFWLAPFSIFFKAVSFLAATLVKYYSDKHWTFEKHEKDGIKKEMSLFFTVAISGMMLNVAIFYYFTKMLGPQFFMPIKTWTELSIILAALGTALWNFLGYKHIVFKK